MKIGNYMEKVTVHTIETKSDTMNNAIASEEGFRCKCIHYNNGLVTPFFKLEFCELNDIRSNCWLL